MIPDVHPVQEELSLGVLFVELFIREGLDVDPELDLVLGVLVAGQRVLRIEDAQRIRLFQLRILFEYLLRAGKHPVVDLDPISVRIEDCIQQVGHVLALAAAASVACDVQLAPRTAWHAARWQITHTCVVVALAAKDVMGAVLGPDVHLIQHARQLGVLCTAGKALRFYAQETHVHCLVLAGSPGTLFANAPLIGALRAALGRTRLAGR